MRKYIFILSVIFSNNCDAQTTTRNSLLGIYSGTYLSYSDFITRQSASKFIALPNDETGIIIQDTLNNITDTMFLCSGEFLCNIMTGPCGYYLPDEDSVYYSRCNGPNGNPTAEFKLKNIYHSFETSIWETTHSKIDISPNPASNNLFINNNIELRNYEIFNIAGQPIRKGVIQDNNNIIISDLPCGLYCLVIEHKNKILSTLFIKE
jgi:hypothetical protein